MQQAITGMLTGGMSVSHLEVINESGNHNVPRGSETHFKVVLVSPEFDGLSPVKRHQLVYRLLGGPLANGVHALALHTYTEAEWSGRQAAPDSPACQGGAKRSG
ncbi:MAG: BolA/IbaG family iron-sulfur metabolism protein [Gammaproteobacteria bacterium]|nr:BolA/IbaG family iron-sulfur metabolism protein [Gammaproteobacteria bacterium]